MEWADYYDRFYDWADSTQISRISGLTDFGSDCSAEVLEIAQCFVDDKVAMRLINKALAGGVRFSVDEVMELTSMVDKPILTRLADTATEPFSKEQLEELYMLIDDDVFERVSKRSNVDIFADEDEDIPVEQAPEPKLGFFTKLGLALGVASENLCPQYPMEVKVPFGRKMREKIETKNKARQDFPRRALKRCVRALPHSRAKSIHSGPPDRL